MRKVIAGIVIALVAAGCGDASQGRPRVAGESILRILPSPSPFTEIAAGPVRALIPDRWHPVLADTGYQEGLIASPRLKDWSRLDGSVEGMAAVWIDLGRVGVPSDYYYLVATGPTLEGLTHSAECRPTRYQVIVDHRPSFSSGAPDSPGDFVARGQGTCTVGATPTRWAYFVAAPGYGPLRRVGIRNSGLYVVVAVLPDSRRAPRLLDKLLGETEFGGARLTKLIAAAKAT